MLFLYDGLTAVVRKYKPDVMAVETPFVGENIKSALAIGKAQAVVLLIAAQNKKPIYEYSPAQVKHHVADYGASSKEQMQEMVKMLLDLDEVPQPNDAADALAVAICHLRESRMRDIIREVNSCVIANPEESGCGNPVSPADQMETRLLRFFHSQ